MSIAAKRKIKSFLAVDNNAYCWETMQKSKELHTQADWAGEWKSLSNHPLIEAARKALEHV